MPLCLYADTRVYTKSFHLNSEDSCVTLANRCSENAEPVSTLSWLFYNLRQYIYFHEFFDNHRFKIVWENIFSFLTRSIPLHILKILVFQNKHSLFKLMFRAIKWQQRPKYDIQQKALFYTLASNVGLHALPIAARHYLWRDFTFFCYKLFIL